MFSCVLMKNLRITFLTVALLGAMTLAATAQTKIATVDMKKLFNGYWKTQQAQTALENRKLDLRKEIKDMPCPRMSATSANSRLRTRRRKSAIPKPPSNNFNARPNPNWKTRASA
jgi:hypothetical protein